MNALPTLRPIDPKPLQEAMATLRSLPEYSGETMEQAEARTVRELHNRGVPVPEVVSYERIAVWRRHDQRLTEIISELTTEREQLRDKLRNVERDL